MDMFEERQSPRAQPLSRSSATERSGERGARRVGFLAVLTARLPAESGLV